MSDLPDLQTPVSDRLYLFYEKLRTAGNIKRSEKYPPSFAEGLNDWPLMYTLVKASQDFVPKKMAGSVTVTRLFVARIVGMPLGMTTDTARGAGSSGYAQLMPIIGKFYAYVLGHPRLSLGTVGDADYLPPLSSPEGAFINQDVQIRDSGVIDEPGPGGLPHYTVDISLLVEMRAKLTGIG